MHREWPVGCNLFLKEKRAPLSPSVLSSLRLAQQHRDGARWDLEPRARWRLGVAVGGGHSCLSVTTALPESVSAVFCGEFKKHQQRAGEDQQREYRPLLYQPDPLPCQTLPLAPQVPSPPGSVTQGWPVWTALMGSFASGCQLGPAPGALPLKTGMGERKEGRGLPDEGGFLRRPVRKRALGEWEGTGRRESTDALRARPVSADRGWKHMAHPCGLRVTWCPGSPGRLRPVSREPGEQRRPRACEQAQE